MADKTIELGEGGYTLTITLHQVVPEKVVYKDSYDKQGVVVPREVAEQGRIIIRDTSARALQARAEQAISLLIPSTIDPNIKEK